MKRYVYITPEDYELAEKNGISNKLLYHRVRMLGWDIDRAVKTKKKGEEYSAEAYRKAYKIGVCRNTVLERIRSGWNVEKAFSTPLKNSGKKIFPDWVYEKAKENGISYSAVYSRVKYGWSLERACTEKLKNNGRKRK